MICPRWVRDFHAQGGTALLTRALTKAFQAKEHKKQKVLVSEWLRAARAFTNNNVKYHIYDVQN